MSNGMTTWDEQGNVQMTTDDFTYQQLHSQVYDLRTALSFSIAVAGFNPATCSAVILPIDEVTESEMMNAINALPYMAVSPGLITISRRNPNTPAGNITSLLRFRLLVMRYAN